MADRNGIDDLDLLAYADGQLVSDPERTSQVEAWLAANPEGGRKMRAYVSQNTALRRAYARRLGDPVPERLYQALENARPRRVLRLVRAGAFAALIGVATGLGWLAGQHGLSADRSLDDFLQQIASHDLTADMLSGALRGGPAEGPVPMPADWPAGGIFPVLRIPELDKLGFAMTHRQTVETGSESLVHLTYENRQGHRFHLFLRPRWDTQATDVQLARRDGLSLAYWLDGPLASAIVADVPPEETSAIARAVRAAMNADLTATAVRMKPPTAPGLAPGLVTEQTVGQAMGQTPGQASGHKTIGDGATADATLTHDAPMPLGPAADGR
jgi:anti-sigma factor RsiW